MALPGPARAVITGGGSGLGRALALELAAPGARIVVADIDEVGAAETLRLVRERGGDGDAARCDVRDPDALESLADLAERLLGGTDLVVNNAGIAVAGRVEDAPLDAWRAALEVNLWGVIHGCRAFVPRMRAARRGHVLNVSSAAGLLTPPALAPYNVTKAAVVALSETLQAELRGTGVGVTVLCPTFFRTNLLDRSIGATEHQQKVVGKLMDRSKAQAPDVARAALAAVRADRLYAVPMSDGRFAWRVKRATPEHFPQVMRRLQKALGRR